jgi:excisionase family DNA binding protein
MQTIPLQDRSVQMAHRDALAAAAEALRRVADALDSIQAARPEPSEDDPLLTVAEIAAELRRSDGFVRQQCRSGAIKAIRDGRGYRARRSVVRTYERRRTA